MKKKQKKKTAQEHLEPLVYRARPICYVNIAMDGALIVLFGWSLAQASYAWWPVCFF